MNSFSVLMWQGLSNATYLGNLHVVYGKIFKIFMEQENQKCLVDEENADRCSGNEERFSAKERQIIKTYQAGEAYRQLCRNEFEDFYKNLWLKTGYFITANGSNVDEIAPE